jgi:hypothetical protein
MNIKYRNNQHKTETSLLEIKESDILHLNKSSQWNYKLPKHISQLQPKLFLTNHRVDYSTCPNSMMMNGENFQMAMPNGTASLHAPHSHITNTVAEYNLVKVHLDNLRRNLERRIKVAQETHNDYLLEILRQESRQLMIN